MSPQEMYNYSHAEEVRYDYLINKYGMYSYTEEDDLVAFARREAKETGERIEDCYHELSAALMLVP